MLARHMLAGVAAFWLAAAVAPCVMAAPDCAGVHTDMSCAMGAPAQNDCDASFDCALPDATAQATATFDFTVPAAVILTTLPFVEPPPSATLRRTAPEQLHSPEPPLNLQHARLLI